MGSPDAPHLREIYASRFAGAEEYRRRVWGALALYFGRWFPAGGSVLDLGAGYCEFINQAPARVRYAMDLNPDVGKRAAEGVIVLERDCTDPWPIGEGKLDAVFTSNFLEHLPGKQAVRTVLQNAYESLKPGGRFIAMGPNVRYVPGAYWDFFDHHVALTDRSLCEALSNCGFEIETRVGRFLPYTMSQGGRRPIWMLRVYLALPAVWPLFGKQFLVVASRPVAPLLPGPGTGSPE